MGEYNTIAKSKRRLEVVRIWNYVDQIFSKDICAASSSKSTIGKVHHRNLFHERLDILLERLMDRIQIDVVVSFGGGFKLDNERMGKAALDHRLGQLLAKRLSGVGVLPLVC